jgi:hypothetical protein
MARYVASHFPGWNNPQLYQLKQKGIFCGLLVVQTFAVHFHWTSNAEVVPAIGNFGRPFVAVALAAAGVSVLDLLLIITKHVLTG